jgi:hypothetical protein
MCALFLPFALQICSFWASTYFYRTISLRFFLSNNMLSYMLISMLSYILSYGNLLLKDQKGKRALEMTIRRCASLYPASDNTHNGTPDLFGSTTTTRDYE